MLKFAVLAITGFVNAQFNSTNLNSTAPQFNSTNLNSTSSRNVTYFNPMVNCDQYMTCDQKIQNVTGQSSKGAVCYKIRPKDSPNGFWNGDNVGLANGLLSIGFPNITSSLTPGQTYKCLSPMQLESGNGGNFTYVPPAQKCQSYESYDYNTGGYRMKEDCWQESEYLQLPGVGDYSSNLTFYIYQVSQSNVQFQNGQQTSDFYMTESAAPAGSKSWGSITTIRQKIMDYFFYAIVQGDSVSSSYGNCSAECGQGQFIQQCCGEFSTIKENYSYGPNGQTKLPDVKDLFYVCINQSVAAAEITMNVMDVNVSLKCAEGTMSGAIKLVSASAIAALAFIAI